MIESKDEYEYVTRYEDIEVIPIMDLHNSAYVEIEEMCLNYNVTGLNTAIKPFFIEYIFKLDYRKVIYFDPDVYVTGNIDEIDRLLDTYSIVITPHILSPIPDDGKAPSEIALHMTGVYNLGFIALRNDDESFKFIKWWQKRLARYSYDRRSDGMFYDQRWVDWAPSLYNNVYILKNPGYNVAVWNLHERSVKKINGKWAVNGVPLIFYHFSGYLPEKPDMVTKWECRHSFNGKEDLHALFNLYRDLMMAEGHRTYGNKTYWFDYFPGTDILIPEFMKSDLYRVRSSIENMYNPGDIADKIIKPEYCVNTIKNPKFGLNIYCPFDIASGMSEVARLIFKTVLSMGVPQCLLPIEAGHRDDTRCRNLVSIIQNKYRSTKAPYSINLFIGNPGEISRLVESSPEILDHKYNIGILNWKFNDPILSGAVIKGIDEIWHFSEFACQIFNRGTSRPNVHITYPLAPTWDYKFGRGRVCKQYGIDKNSYIFFCDFDFEGYWSKNPGAAVDSFTSAFPKKTEKVYLIARSTSAKLYPDEALEFKNNVKNDRRIIWLDGAMSRENFISAMNACDCYLSLHRFETFGAGMAEAMYLGKCVMATAYGGNLEFMNDYNSILISTRRSGPKDGIIWAEPSTDSVIKNMKMLYDNRDIGVMVGNRAYSDIRVKLLPKKTASEIYSMIL